jgi:hypothetical protein
LTPLGGSVAFQALRPLDFDSSSDLVCPYCGEPAEVDVDPGGGEDQEFEQDCAVCCRPWQVRVQRAEDGTETITLTREDD